MTKQVKQDINFLENPLWVQRDKNKRCFELKDGGFTITSPRKPPTRLDILFLYYLLWLSQQNDWQETIVVSHNEILKSTGVDTGGKHRKRLRESLDRWSSILLSFEGTFYDGVKYKSFTFHIIDSWKQREGDNLLRIRFSPEWLLQIQNSTFFERIDIVSLSKLKSSLATRLYEILSKSFHGRSIWKIDAKKLALKIPMEEKYPSSLERKIRPALRKIQERTNLNVELEIEKKERGKAIFVFRKKTNSVSFEDVKPTSKAPIILSKVREKEKRTQRLRGILSQGLKEHEESYVLRQILYANEQAKSNYSAFLEKAIKNDWGTEWKEALDKEEEVKTQKKEEQQQEQKKQREQEKSQEQSSVFQTLAKQQWETMSEEAREELKREVLNKYPEYKDPENPFAKTGLKLQMLSTLAKRIEKAFQASS